MICSCGKAVEQERAELGLEICFACAQSVQKVKGIMVVDGKSFVDIVVVSESEHAKLMRRHRLSGNQSAPK